MEIELTSVVDALPGLIWTARPDGHVDFVNKRWSEYTGLTLDEAAGKGWLSAALPEDLPQMQHRWRAALTAGEPFEMEARMRRFDGKYLRFFLRVRSIVDVAGNVVKWCGINTPIDYENTKEAWWPSTPECEDYFRPIADSIPALIALMTPTGEVESVNRHALEYYGVTLDELKRWAGSDMVHPDDLPQVVDTWTKSVQNGQPYEIEHRIRRADGVYRWFRVSGLPIRDSQGTVVRWCVLQTDIDDRKRVEALLAGEKRVLEMIATGESVASTLTKLCLLVEELCPRCISSSISLLDPQTKKLWYAASPNVPKAYTEAANGFFADPHVCSCGAAVHYEKQIVSSDIASDSEWRMFRNLALENGLRAACSTPITSPHNRVVGTITIFYSQPATPNTDEQQIIAQTSHLASIAIERESSQRSLARALDELTRSERRLRRTIDAIPGFVWSTAPDGSVDFLNRRWCDYTGVSMEDAVGWGWAAAIHPDDADGLATYWRSALKSGQPGEIEARMRRFDGAFRWFLMRAVPIRNEAGAIVKWYGTNTDIEDRKQAEALLASEKRLLEMVARGHSLKEILEALCQLVEGASSDCYCSVALVDASGKRLEHGATPSLPTDFINSIIGRPVGVDSGPCALAAYLNEQVVCCDLTVEERWVGCEWRREALAVGLRACWAVPIISTTNQVLGAFAIYYQEPGMPTRLHQNLIEQFKHIASIAVERAQNDAALKGSEARKTAILDSALDCVVTIDHQGRVTEFNPAAERTFRYRRNDVVGQYLADLIVPPGQRESHRRGLAHYVATGESHVLGRRIEMTAVRSDGSEFPVELAITRIPLDGPPSFTGYLRDVTERKQAEEELRRSEAFLAQSQYLSRIGSFLWRVTTNEITWSEELYRIFEMDRGTIMTLELIGARVHPDDIPLLHDMVARANCGVDAFEYEHRLLMPDQSIKYLHLMAHRTQDKSERLEYIGAVQDVTQRRLSEEALSKARSELAHVARVTSLGVLTASIAHEVNQPLAGIVTNASTCLRMLAADPPNVEGARETARRTIRDGNRASEVVTRLRALFTKKDGPTEQFDLNEATREVIALSASELQRNRVISRLELADPLPLVTGDRVQLQQVILNLVLNASDAMSTVDDRPRHLVIRTEKYEGDSVCLSVQDTGVGLDPSGMDKLFEAFYTTKSEGMGIGLSVSRSIIESHRGRLWASSHDGPGATFSFCIRGRPTSAMNVVSGGHGRPIDADAAGAGRRA